MEAKSALLKVMVTGGRAVYRDNQGPAAVQVKRFEIGVNNLRRQEGRAQWVVGDLDAQVVASRLRGLRGPPGRRPPQAGYGAAARRAGSPRQAPRPHPRCAPRTVSVPPFSKNPRTASAPKALALKPPKRAFEFGHCRRYDWLVGHPTRATHQETGDRERG